MATSAFGRLRVCEPYTLFEYFTSKMTDYDNSKLDMDIWNTIIPTDTSSNYHNDGYLFLRSINGKITRTSKKPMDYQPGKSRLVYMSGILVNREITSGEDIKSRMGIFDVDGSGNITEGLYLEIDSSGISFNEKHKNYSVNKVYQTNWNIDNFDGDGPSGKTFNGVDITKNILLIIDQEWLGVGRVRLGLNINGINYYGHEFNHNLQYPYTSNPRNSLTYQLDCSNLSTPIDLRQICCTVLSEGGYTPIGRRNLIQTDFDGVKISNNNKYVVLALKINSNYTNSIVNILGLKCFHNGGGTYCKYELQLHTQTDIGNKGSISSSINFTPLDNSIVEYYKGDSSNLGPYITEDGYIINSGIVEKKDSITSHNNVYDTTMARNQITKYDILYLVAESNTNNPKLVSSLDFIESI